MQKSFMSFIVYLVLWVISLLISTSVEVVGYFSWPLFLLMWGNITLYFLSGGPQEPIANQEISGGETFSVLFFLCALAFFSGLYLWDLLPLAWFPDKTIDAAAYKNWRIANGTGAVIISIIVVVVVFFKGGNLREKREAAHAANKK